MSIHLLTYKSLNEIWKMHRTELDAFHGSTSFPAKSHSGKWHAALKQGWFPHLCGGKNVKSAVTQAGTGMVENLWKIYFVMSGAQFDMLLNMMEVHIKKNWTNYLQSSWSWTAAGSMIDTHAWLHCTHPQGIVFKTKMLVSLLQMNSFITSFEPFDRYKKAQKCDSSEMTGLHSFFTVSDKNSRLDVQSSVFLSCPLGNRPWGKPRRCWRDNISNLSWECLFPYEQLKNVTWKCKRLSLCHLDRRK